MLSSSPRSLLPEPDQIPMPARRRFDGVHLRRNRNGPGLRVMFSDAEISNPTEMHDAAGRSGSPDNLEQRGDAPSAQASRRRRSRRRGEVKSIALTVIGTGSAPVSIGTGEISIGADPGNDVVLAGPGILPRHARVTLDGDGAMLRLPQPQLDVRLNHRRVESLAFLHDGDIIEIGSDSIAVEIVVDRSAAPANRDEQDGRATRVRRVPPRFVLRGVTGSQFGKLIPIYGRLVIGRGNECDLVLDEPGLSRRHAVIETLPDGLFLRDLGSANGSYLNGQRVRDAALRHGDQIVVDSVRFLVQAIDQLDQPAVALPVRPPTRLPRWLVWTGLGLLMFCAGIVATLMLVR